MNKELNEEKKRPILIADDDALFLHIVSKILTEAGFEVITAGSGEEALKILSRKNPALIILDSNMPKMSGEEVCKKLKKSESNKRTIPIIILSGLEDEDSIKRFTESGCDDYFPKSKLIYNFSSALKEKVYKALKSL